MEKIINFETAKLAKEKGFSMPFFKDTKYYSSVTGILHSSSSVRDLERPHIVKACPISILQKWLREEKGISVDVFTALKENNLFKYGCDMMALFSISDEWQSYNLNKYFDTYEEALEAGINKAMEFINP